MEHYTHKVFSRIARQGHYVALLCQNHHRVPFIHNRSQTIESIDGIQVFRLGGRMLYRPMVGLFFSRLTRPGTNVRQFDVVVDCVSGHPFPVSKYTATPVVPIVFGHAAGIQTTSESPGPVIAPSEEAFRLLRSAGVPKRCVIRVPFAATPVDDLATAMECPRSNLLAVGGSSQPLARALQRLSRKGVTLELDAFGPPRWGHSVAETGAFPTPQALARARIAYCGEGFEWMALTFSALGIPCVCPHTAAGREYVEHGTTGYLHRPGDASHLADLLEQLLSDELLLKRMARAAAERGAQTSWDRSASLVLATIENLFAPAPGSLVTV